MNLVEFYSRLAHHAICMLSPYGAEEAWWKPGTVPPEDEFRLALELLISGNVLVEEGGQAETIRTKTMTTMLAGVRAYPQYAGEVANWAVRFVQDHSLGTQYDALIGSWSFASSLLLNLPESALHKMVLPHSAVELMRQEARIMLGFAHMHGTRYQGKANINEAAELAWSMAHEAFEDPRGRELAEHLGRALQILDDNAERLRKLAGMGLTIEDLPPGEPLALYQLLDLFVKDPVPAAEVTGIEYLALTHVPDDAMQPGAADVGETKAEAAAAMAEAEPPAVTIHAPQQRAKQSRQQAAAQESPAPAAAAAVAAQGGPRTRSVALVATGKPVRENKQPGSQPDNPDSHKHPRNERALPRAMKHSRRATHHLRVLGELPRFGEAVTGSTLQQLADMDRAGRLVRNYGTTEVRGGDLVQHDPLTGRRRVISDNKS
jgi:hypothetical protein